MSFHPSLELTTIAGVEVLTDRSAREAGISIAFTTRAGGVSPSPFDSLNLSASDGDDGDNVAANRSRVAAVLDVEPDDLKLARQVHATGVVECDPGTDPGEADALVTRAAGVAVGVLTADCVPVLLLGDDVAAAVHAGWRGIVAGVVGTAVEQMGGATQAWVGPSIRGCCYTVGPDVTSAFEENALPLVDQWHVDPSAAVSALLRRAGVEDIAASGICTSCDNRFFSYRRDKKTGRQGGFISLR